MRPPGAEGDLKSPALTTALICGGATDAAYPGGRIVTPEVVRLTNALPSCSIASDRVKALSGAGSVSVLLVQSLVAVVVVPFELLVMVQIVMVCTKPVWHVSTVLVEPFGLVVVLVEQFVPITEAGCMATRGASTIDVGLMLLPVARFTFCTTPGKA